MFQLGLACDEWPLRAIILNVDPPYNAPHFANLLATRNNTRR
jgi:hypothetical protein